jgi:hypothetical protein
MYSRFLDRKTYAEVIAEGPDPIPVDFMLVRELVAKLESWMEFQPELNAGEDMVFWQASVGDLTEQLMTTVEPRRVGYILRELGLPGVRTRSGYVVSFTRKQVELLKEALKL